MYVGSQGMAESYLYRPRPAYIHAVTVTSWKYVQVLSRSRTARTDGTAFSRTATQDLRTVTLNIYKDRVHVSKAVPRRLKF